MFVLLLKLLKCKYRFKLPKPCEILIFDGNYNLTLNNYLKKHKFDVFFIRGEELNLSVFFLQFILQR